MRPGTHPVVPAENLTVSRNQSEKIDERKFTQPVCSTVGQLQVGTCLVGLGQIDDHECAILFGLASRGGFAQTSSHDDENIILFNRTQLDSMHDFPECAH